FDVPDDKSIVDVLRENGVQVNTSCESGLCGTCRTRFLEGEPEHHDYVLDADERRSEVLICCARSKTATLVLDL
ncbi:MAG TPA: 2Fe-2S iron-sulfur cluster binding domain-containing protein, partial [Ramlibacter sp.]|nr:2Fe-2S iron-sulfur cluster binding domain-containing protein [Ramlibacter sp.]